MSNQPNRPAPPGCGQCCQTQIAGVSVWACESAGKVCPQVAAQQSSSSRALTGLQTLTKWRRVLMWWQLGDRPPRNDPEAAAVSDHREATLIHRAELAALTALLVQKGIFTRMEFTAQVEVEAEHYSEMMAQKFPGLTADDTGINVQIPQGAVTLNALYQRTFEDRGPL